MDTYLKYVIIVLGISIMGASPSKKPLDPFCVDLLVKEERLLMSLRLEERILGIVEHRYNNLDEWSRDEVKRRITIYKGNMRHIREAYIDRGLRIPYDEPRYTRRYIPSAHRLLRMITGQTPYFVSFDEHNGLPLVDHLLVQDVFMYMITMALINLYTVDPHLTPFQSEIDAVYRKVLPSNANRYLQRIGFLLRQGTHPNLYTGGLTYLMWASAYGLDHLVELLIQQEANQNLRSTITDGSLFHGATALKIAQETLELYIQPGDIYEAYVHHSVYRYTNWRELARRRFDLRNTVLSYNRIIEMLSGHPTE